MIGDKKLKSIIKQAENLTEHGTLLRSILNSSTEYAIIAADLKRTILTWNTGAEKIFGYSPEEVIGEKNLSFLIPRKESKSERTKKRIQARIAQKGLWQGETIRKRKNGETFFARIIVTPLKSPKGHEIGSLAVIRDITKEKKLTEEIINAHIVNDQILNSIPSGIVVLDSKGLIITCNQAFEALRCFQSPAPGKDLCSALSCKSDKKECDVCTLPLMPAKAFQTSETIELEQTLRLKINEKILNKHFLIRIRKIHLLKKIHFLIVFNDYTVKVNLERRIKEHARTLEEKVTERTKEIRRTHKMLMEDLSSARRIQRSLLLNNIKKIPGYSYSYKYIPSKLIGGDFFQIGSRQNGKYYFYICDVSGHGIPAAMLTVFIQQSIRIILDRNPQSAPGDILSRLNRRFYKEAFSGSPFVTAYFCLLDPADHSIQYAVAGHHNSFLLQPKKKHIKKTGYYSKPIGLVPEYEYKTGSFRLDPGESFFLYTDGLTDIFSKKGKRIFSESALQKFLRKNIGLSGPDLSRQTVSLARSLNPGKDFEDDIAVLQIKRDSKN